ncbi:MAG: hypothetical protein CMP34_03800 [Rickettsiales bacterium]|nr:hypothetical protein [Rickettsiales bacterium]
MIDSNLKSALENLYNYSPKLKYERKILMSKDELLPQAYSNFRPEIKGYYEKGKVDTNPAGFNIISEGVRTETNKGFTITQKLFNGGSSLSNVNAAKNEILAQRFFLKQIEQEVFLEAIKIYGDLATEISNLDLKKKNLEFLERQLNLTKQQFEIGEVTLTDVSIAEARFSLGKSEILKTSSTIESLSAKYFALFGIVAENPQLFDGLVDKNSFKLEEIKVLGKKKNPKILNVYYQIKSLEKKVQSLKRKRLPSVKLEAEAKINQGYFRTDSEREVLSAFTKVDIPLYQSGAASSKIREEKKKLFALKELLSQNMKEIEFNIVSSFSSLNSSFSRIEAYEKQIESNIIFLEGLKQELLLGERTTLDLLDGEQELLKSQLDLVIAKRDLFISYYEILFYLGKLNAKNLKLDVELFDEKENYNKVKFKWLDLVE